MYFLNSKCVRSIFLFSSQTLHLHWTAHAKDRYYDTYFRCIKLINLRMCLHQSLLLH